MESHGVLAIKENMKTLATSSVGPVLLCLTTAFHISLGGPTQFAGADKLPLTNEESVSQIPSVYRLLKGLNEARQVLPSGNTAAFQQNHKKTQHDLSKHQHDLSKHQHDLWKHQHDLWKHPIFDNVFSNRKKSIHELLHRILNARVQLREGSHPSIKFKSSDSSEIKGSFKISDETVSGKGEYAISPDQTDVGIKMKLRINKQQQQPSPPPQRQKQMQQLTTPLPPRPSQSPSPPLSSSPPPQPPPQQQQPKPTRAITPKRFPSTTPKMCLVPCNTTLKPHSADCIPSQFEQEALSIHNRYRAIHNAPALTLNCEMSKNAAAYAQKLADLDTLVQSSYTERPEQGENIALGCYQDREETAEEAIKGWFDEVCQYTFGKQGPQSGTSHFTQLAWKDTTELGIGKAINKQSNGATCTFIVARYKPQGNFENGDNAYLKNIEKGSFDESYCKNILKAGLEGGYGFKRFQNSY